MSGIEKKEFQKFSQKWTNQKCLPDYKQKYLKIEINLDSGIIFFCQK